MTTIADPARRRDPEVGMAHQALFYRDSDEYLSSVLEFVRPGLEAGEPVAMAVPSRNLTLLERHLDGYAGSVELFDMVELGHNPARIIPAVQSMLDRHEGRPLHYVGEPIWAGRSPGEIREATRHEALINLAWSNAPIRVLCPYDAAALDGTVLRDAERTHPDLIRDGQLFSSTSYDGAVVPHSCEHALPAPPATASRIRFEPTELWRVRALVAEYARSAGLTDERVADLTLAADELAANTVKHAGASGSVAVWSESDQVLCEVEGPGWITDPLAGRRQPPPEPCAGRGLWIVNQVCDLVETRTSSAGTIVRVHVCV
jgi:anti-sigma regulatory factor (Ser/Thr protein kinase)